MCGLLGCKGGLLSSFLRDTDLLYNQKISCRCIDGAMCFVGFCPRDLFQRKEFGSAVDMSIQSSTALITASVGMDGEGQAGRPFCGSRLANATTEAFHCWGWLGKWKRACPRCQVAFR